MRRKSLWKKTLAVTLSAAMLLSVPSEALFAETNPVVSGETESVEIAETETLETEQQEKEREVTTDSEEKEQKTELEEEISLLGLEGNETSTPAEYFGYYENDDGTIEITDYTGSDTEVVIPEQIDGKDVTSIGDEAFEYCSDLTSIAIPSSVKGIGRDAFFGCSSLTSITIPSSVESIGDCAFDDCSSLESITIPSSVESIGDFAFDDCSSLTSITISEGVERIGKCAFDDCSSLESITIPSSVISIGYSAFRGCSGLTSIKVEESNTVYTSADSNCIIKRDNHELILGCKNTLIPEEVESIGNGAFYGCSNLTSITIPSSVESIGYDAFSYCSGLTSIQVEEDNTVYTSADSNCIIKRDNHELILGCKNTVIPGNVESIGEYAFFGCSSLTSITIPSSVESIRFCAFLGCSSLTSITIPSSVKDIGISAFMYCSSLTSITIPSSVESIRDGAFNGCSSLTSIAIPSSVKGIGRDAFGNCSSLTSITISEGVESIGDSAFVRCSSLTSITIPSSVESIGNHAFAYCDRLTIYCTPDSYAQSYALDNDIPYKFIEEPICSHANTELCYAKSATCTETGYTGDTYCKDCGDCIRKGENIAALGHSYTGKVTKQPTVDEEGVKTYTCSQCQHSYTEKIAKLNAALSTYTVKFNGNGSTSGSMTKQKMSSGQKTALSANKFKKKGYTFTGWNTKKDGSGTSYKNKAKVQNLSVKSDGKVTLYAQWKKTKYKITYKLNKGTNHKKNPSSYTITTKTITLKSPTRKGYTFKGWYSDKKCTKKVNKIKKGSTGKVTLYAKWAKK